MTAFHLSYGILGCLAALLSAGAWALCSILFRKIGDKASPLAMNLGKCFIGTVYLAIVIFALGSGHEFIHMKYETFLLLGVSGLLGISIGDTFFFKALIYLGPKLMMLLETVCPIFVVFLAVVLFNEKLLLLDWAGIVLIIGGIDIVLWKEAEKDEGNKNLTSGIIYAVLFSLCFSISIILIKFVFENVEKVSALEANFVRLLWGFAGLAVWGLLNRRLREWLSPFKDYQLLKLIFFSVFIAVFGGFWLSLVALKYTLASLATVFNSTTPLFVLPMAAVMLKKKVTFIEVIGAAMAVMGVSLIFFNR